MPGETGSLILSKDCKLGQKEREAIFTGETIKMGELTGLSREEKGEKRDFFQGGTFIQPTGRGKKLICI